MFHFMSQSYCLINCLTVLSGHTILKECFQERKTEMNTEILFLKEIQKWDYCAIEMKEYMSICLLNKPYHWNSIPLFLLLGYSAKVEQDTQDFLSWPIKLLESQVLKLGHRQPYKYFNNLCTQAFVWEVCLPIPSVHPWKAGVFFFS